MGAAGGIADMVVLGAADDVTGVVRGAVDYFVLSRQKNDILLLSL